MTTPASVHTSLKAFAEDKAHPGITKLSGFRVDPNLIKIEEGFNLREDGDETALHIDQLFAAYMAGAFVPPIDVQVDADGNIIARDGHCRTQAARRVKEKLPEFTVEVRQLRGNDQDAVLHMLGTGVGSKPLTPLEAGRGFLRLIKMGLKEKDIAAKLGLSSVTIGNGIKLAEAPTEVQALVSSGAVSATTARHAIEQGKEGVEALKTAAAAAKAEPKKGKKGAKVTAKKLAGTKAEKGAKNKAKKAKADKKKPDTAPVVPVTPTAPVVPVDPNLVTVSVSKESAHAAFEFIRDYGMTGNPLLDTFRAALESALL